MRAQRHHGRITQLESAREQDASQVCALGREPGGHLVHASQLSGACVHTIALSAVEDGTIANIIRCEGVTRGEQLHAPSPERVARGCDVTVRVDGKHAQDVRSDLHRKAGEPRALLRFLTVYSLLQPCHACVRTPRGELEAAGDLIHCLSTHLMAHLISARQSSVDEGRQVGCVHYLRRHVPRLATSHIMRRPLATARSVGP
mmetsp:Transcript_737/g.2012  ORF Transcript_737/g.2012 Transcript_737/m.2012 type:complete len:202 (+) Transcript_737:1748-2353(+)